MQLPSVTSLTPVTRQERLELWMRRSAITFLRLGEICGISGVVMSQHLRAETMPVRHHAALLAAGMPAELLPGAQDQKPGPKPKAERDASRADVSPDSHGSQATPSAA